MLASTQIYVYMSIQLYTEIREFQDFTVLKTIKDRGLSFGMVPTHTKFQVLTPFGS